MTIQEIVEPAWTLLDEACRRAGKQEVKGKRASRAFTEKANFQHYASLASQSSSGIQSEVRELGTRGIAVCMKNTVHSQFLCDLNKHWGFIDEDSLLRSHLSYI